MEKFGDPYTRYVPSDAMVLKKQRVRGETIGTGADTFSFYYL